MNSQQHQHQHQHQQPQQHQQNMHTGSGLTRYRSAPSSYFASFLNTPSSERGGFGADDFERLFNPRASSPETQRIFSKFMNSGNTSTIQENCVSDMPLLSESKANSQFMTPPKIEPAELQLPELQLQRQQSNEYTQMIMCQSCDNSSEAVISASGDKRTFDSFDSGRVSQKKMQRVEGGSGLIRHSSSPAGLFANINIENEFGTMRAMENLGGGNIANAEASFSSATRFKSHTSSAMMDPISEMGSGEDRVINEGRGDNVGYITGFSMNSWDDSAVVSDDFLKGLTDDDQVFLLCSPKYTKNEGGNRPTTLLSHHLSLPKSAMEKLLQDSVPCKMRAKRGCATHPRSIAERVRRTKISERMRRLQELVPNMEKQTNTSDMLDLAVEYIKDLQRQVKTLSDNREKCCCEAKPRS